MCCANLIYQRLLSSSLVVNKTQSSMLEVLQSLQQPPQAGAWAAVRHCWQKLPLLPLHPQEVVHVLWMAVVATACAAAWRRGEALI